MTKQEIMLSVVVPVYNAERYIEKCVKSILKQNYLTMEIILIDDGSTDNSGTLCDILTKESQCIRTVHTKNGGITKARFIGASLSKGKWITFVDADDWIDDAAYKDFEGENDCDIVITGICRYIDANHQDMQLPYLREGIYDKNDILNEIIPNMLWTPKLNDWALDPSLCTKIFKREIVTKFLDKASKVESNYGEDSIVIFPIMLYVKSVRISKKVYYYHRQREKGVVSPYIKDEDFIPKLYKVYEYLKDQFIEMGYWNIMKKQLDCFFINAIEIKKRCYEYPAWKLSVYFPIDRIPRKSKVILYGAGYLGKQYWKQNILYHFCTIIAWVDMNYIKKKSNNYTIENPSIIKEREYDFVLIAVDNYFVAKDIVRYLIKIGVKREKIIWQSIRVNGNDIEKNS